MGAVTDRSRIVAVTAGTAVARVARTIAADLARATLRIRAAGDARVRRGIADRRGITAIAVGAAIPGEA